MLSIIIITKNEENNLSKLIESIKNQDYTDYEIVVSDAKSTDRTREIAKEAGCRVVEGGMPSIGRNNGAKAAKGDILLFLDADVTLPKGFLSETMQEFEGRELSAAGCYVKPKSTKVVDKVYHRVLNSFMWSVQRVYPHMPGFCIFVRKSVHNKLRGFDPDILLAEDNDYVNRSKRFGDFRMLNSRKILCSVRRFEKEGHLRSGIKYILCPLYRVVFGEIKTDIFKYKFDHYDKDDSKGKIFKRILRNKK